MRSHHQTRIRPISSAAVTLLYVLCLPMFVLPTAVVAQDLQGGRSAGQIERRLQPAPEPLAVPKPLTVPQAPASQAPAGAEEVRFQLNDVLLEGVTAFDVSELIYLYDDLLGEEVSLVAIYELSALLTRHYTDAGYLLSRTVVPAQTIEGGVVRLQVIEGYIDEVVIEGLEDRRPDLLNHYTEQLMASRPLTQAVLERYLLLANDLPGMQFRALLGVSEDNLGAASLTLVPSKDAWQGLVSLDNRGARTSGPWQALIEATANDLFGRLDRTTLRFATVPDQPEELKYLQFSHAQVLNGEGLTASLDLSATDSEPGGTVLETLDVETFSRRASLSFSFPVIRSRQRNLQLGGGLTIRESRTKQLGQTTADDDLRILQLTASLFQADGWGGGGVNLFSAGLNQGIDAFDAKVNSRASATPDFTSLFLQARRNQVIDQDWSMDVRVGGQLSNGTLPSSEQFGLGGESTVRGYEPSEFTGDEALVGGFELVRRTRIEDLGDAQLYGFADTGKIWRDNPAVGQNRTETLSSAGFGARLGLPNNLALNLEVVRTLDTDSFGDSPEWRMFGRVELAF